MEDESSSSRNQRPEEDRDPGLDPDLPDLDLGPDPDLEAAQDLAEAVTKELAPNLEAEADRLHQKTALGAVQDRSLPTRMTTERMDLKLKLGRGLQTRMRTERTTERMESVIQDHAPENVEEIEIVEQIAEQNVEQIAEQNAEQIVQHLEADPDPEVR